MAAGCAHCALPYAASALLAGGGPFSGRDWDVWRSDCTGTRQGKMTIVHETRTETLVTRHPVRPSGRDGVKAGMKSFYFCVVLIAMGTTNRAAAQCLSAPPAYSAVCTEMQGYISTFNTTVSSQWNDTDRKSTRLN